MLSPRNCTVRGFAKQRLHRSSAIIASFRLSYARHIVPLSAVPNHTIGSNHTFGNLSKAYAADFQSEGDAHFLLYRGTEILALCLRARFNPKPEEVWVGDTTEVAKWGERLASLKGTKTVPVYYSPKGRTLYEFRGHHLITGDTTAKDDLEKARGPVPLSRIVYIKPVPKSAVP